MKSKRNFSLGMNKLLKGFVALGILWLFACATDAGESFDPAETCPAEGLNAYGFPNRGTFVDPRDGKEYRYTTIGKQVWMAQNLDYESTHSVRHDSLSDCEICGRGYNLMRESGDRGSLDSFCPEGWKVPTEEDWKILFSAIGGKSNAYDVLISEIWDKDYQGADECGFSGIVAQTILVLYDGPVVLRWQGGAYWWTQTVTRLDILEGVHFSMSDHKIRWEEMWGYYFIPVRCVMDL